MSKIFNAVFGPSFTTKIESLLGNAREVISCSLPEFQKGISEATTDVTKSLKLGNHKKAYRKVDIVIKKQNYFDVCTLIIGYLDLLIAGVHLFKPNRDIPQELLEAVSSLLFAAPSIRLWCSCSCIAIQDVRNFLLSRFGQNLAAQYLELRNNCGIDPQIIEKLSKEPSTREVRMKFLQEIAAKENIVLKLEDASTPTGGISDVSKAKLASEERVEDEIREGCGLSDQVNRGKKKQTDMDDAGKIEGSSSNGPENKKSGEEDNGNDDGLATRAKKKKINGPGKAVGSSSNGPENKEEQDGSDDGLAKRAKKKKINGPGKAVGSSSNGPENKESGEEQDGSDDGLAKRAKKKKTNGPGKAVGSSSNGPENKESGEEQDGNDDGLAKRAKKKKINGPGKAVGSSSNGPENKESGQGQESNDDDFSDGEGDVRSESTRTLSDSGISIKLDEGTVELLKKDVDINWNAEETGHVDLMVHSVEDTTGLKGPFSVRTRRFINSEN